MALGSFAGGMFDGYLRSDENRRQNVDSEQQAQMRQIAIEEAARRQAEEGAARKLEADLLASGGVDSVGVPTYEAGTKFATPGANFANEADAVAAAQADTAQAAQAVASNRPAYLPEGATYAPNTTDVQAIGANGSPAAKKVATFADKRNEILAGLPKNYQGLGLDRAQKVVDQVFAQKQGQLFQKAVADGDIDSLVRSIAQAPEGYEVRSGTNPKTGEFAIGFINPKTGQWHGGAPRAFESKEHALAEFGTSFSQNPKDYTDYWLRMAEMMRKRDATDQSLALRAEIAGMRENNGRAPGRLGGGGRSGGAGAKDDGDPKPQIGYKEFMKYPGLTDEAGNPKPEAAGGYTMLQKLRHFNRTLAGSVAGEAVAAELARDLAIGKVKPSVTHDAATGMWQQTATAADGKTYRIDEMSAVNPSAMGMPPEQVKAAELGWLQQAAQQDPAAYTEAAQVSLDPKKMAAGLQQLRSGTLTDQGKRQYQMAFLIGQANNGAYKADPVAEKKAAEKRVKNFGGLNLYAPGVRGAVAPSMLPNAPAPDAPAAVPDTLRQKYAGLAG